MYLEIAPDWRPRSMDALITRSFTCRFAGRYCQFLSYYLQIAIKWRGSYTLDYAIQIFRASGKASVVVG